MAVPNRRVQGMVSWDGIASAVDPWQKYVVPFVVGYLGILTSISGFRENDSQVKHISIGRCDQGSDDRVSLTDDTVQA